MFLRVGFQMSTIFPGVAMAMALGSQRIQEFCYYCPE